MPSVSALERCSRAVGVLADEKGRIKERLLIAYASQLSQIDVRKDLPEDSVGDFIMIRNALSDAEMPYGSGERAATKINTLNDDEASSFARKIFSLFLKLSGIRSEQAAN